MHARAVKRQAAFATKRVVAAEDDGTAGYEVSDQKASENPAQRVECPGGMAEEAMKAAPVALADSPARKDALGDEALPGGENPAGGQCYEGPKRRLREDGAKVVQQPDEGGSKIHGSASLPRAMTWVFVDIPKLPIPSQEADLPPPRRVKWTPLSRPKKRFP
jgi:hypothetical protein